MIDTKFKLWTRLNHKLYQHSELSIDYKHGIVHHMNESFKGNPTFEMLEDCDILPFTGFKDKDNEEIYKSDILAFDAREWYRSEYKEGMEDYVFEVTQSETGEWIGAGICTEWPVYCKKVGNKYEN